jgi:hypothetical protein
MKITNWHKFQKGRNALSSLKEDGHQQNKLQILTIE